MKRRSPFAAMVAAMALLLAGAFGGCAQPGTDDSETHFLASCTTGCTGGLQCICGVCTKPCTDAGECPAVTGVVCEDACSETGDSVCDVVCARDGDCAVLGAGFMCTQGRCREGRSGMDAGSDVTTPEGSPGTRPDAARVACKVDPVSDPVMPDLSTVDPDAMARAAAVLAACVPPLGADGASGLLWASAFRSPQVFYGRAATQLDCLASAGCGCDAIQHCLGIEDTKVDGLQECQPSCDGDVWSLCSQDAGVRVDCGKVGLRCDPFGGCVEGEVVSCIDSTFVSTCTPDGRESVCEGNVVRHGPPCSSLGLSCENGLCKGTENACETSSTRQNAVPRGFGCLPDGTLDACWNGGRTRIDCSTRGPGFTCQQLPEMAFCGLAAECRPEGMGHDGETDTPRCDGDVLTFCNAGRLEHLDCGALGFEGCEIDASRRYHGCLDARRCGNREVDPGELCDDGNDDELDGCHRCGYSCNRDEDCAALKVTCTEQTCQDHRCIETVNKRNGTLCTLLSGERVAFGACESGRCELPTTCSGTLYGMRFETSCPDPDGNPCNGTPRCESPSSPEGSCGAMGPALAPGSDCGDDGVCNANQLCVANRCGNGVVDGELGEQCDPPGVDGCSATCGAVR